MTVSTTQIEESWAGDASSVTFPIPFPFLDRAHLIVWKEDALGTKTSMTIVSATGEGDSSGGSITLSEAVGVGYTLHVRRNTPKTQETDYVPNDPFPADSHERALDKLTMIVQELIASGSINVDVKKLRELIGDSSTIVWTISPDGTKLIASVANCIAWLESFPLNACGGTLWLRDSSGDLWDGDPSLAFRCDFVVNGCKWLRGFRSIFYTNAGTPTGRFAIYGNGTTKLVDQALPDSSLYGVTMFSSPIDISGYEFLSVVMDPGVSAAPQPVAQSIDAFPVSSGLGRWTFAHMVEHDHNTEFPETVPTLPDFDMKYCLARWCAIGVQ